MLYELEEVIFSELPVMEEKDDTHFTIEDILNTEQSLDDFRRSAFYKTVKYERTLYVPLYKRKGA